MSTYRWFDYSVFVYGDYFRVCLCIHVCVFTYACVVNMCYLLQKDWPIWEFSRCVQCSGTLRRCISLPNLDLNKFSTPSSSSSSSSNVYTFVVYIIINVSYTLEHVSKWDLKRSTTTLLVVAVEYVESQFKTVLYYAVLVICFSVSY